MSSGGSDIRNNTWLNNLQVIYKQNYKSTGFGNISCSPSPSNFPTQSKH